MGGIVSKRNFEVGRYTLPVTLDEHNSFDPLFASGYRPEENLQLIPYGSCMIGVTHLPEWDIYFERVKFMKKSGVEFITVRELDAYLTELWGDVSCLVWTVHKFDSKGDAEGVGFSVYKVENGAFTELK